MYLFLLQDSNTVFFPIVPFMCGYENTFNHHQSSCSLLTTYLMSGNICGKGLNKKQGVNEEKEQFIVILMVVSVLHNTVHTCVRNWSMIKLSGPVTYFYSFSYWHSSCNLHAHTLLITLFEEILRKSHYILNYVLIYLYIDVSLWNLLNVKFVVCEIWIRLCFIHV